MAEEKPVKEKTSAEKLMLRSIRRYARASGYMIQPNKKILNVLIKGLLNNIKKYGHKYCPCRKVAGNPIEDKKIICPCIFHKDEIKADGYCKCMLYYRKVK
jgi:ferredoxin-thioredoxin reductase catalytic subunit